MRPASSSPANKRQRLSSPTYEDQLGELTQEDLAAFDAIEAQFSQGSIYNKGGSRKQGIESVRTTPSSWDQFEEEPSSSLPVSGKSLLKNADKFLDDPDNPFSPAFSSSMKAPAQLPLIGFKSASTLSSTRNADQFHSPEVPERNYDDWFMPAPTELSTAFVKPVFTKAFLTSGSAKPLGSIIVPSEAALEKAKAKLAAWEKEDAMVEDKGSELLDFTLRPGSSKLDTRSSAKSPYLLKDRHSPKRPALRTMSSVLNTPDTPSPASETAAVLEVQRKTILSSLHSQLHVGFRSPLQARLHSSAQPNFSGSPLNPNQNGTFASASSNLHRHFDAPLIPSSPSVAPSTLRRSNITTPTTRTRPAKFVTPFKSNMRPGESGGLFLPQMKMPTSVPIPKNTTSRSTINHTLREATPRKNFFSMSKLILIYFTTVKWFLGRSSTRKEDTCNFWPLAATI